MITDINGPKTTQDMLLVERLRSGGSPECTRGEAAARILQLSDEINSLKLELAERAPLCRCADEVRCMMRAEANQYRSAIEHVLYKWDGGIPNPDPDHPRLSMHELRGLMIHLRAALNPIGEPDFSEKKGHTRI